MRWFIVFLLIANILLFFWVQQEALRPSSHTDIPPPEIGELRLLNEPPTPEVTALQGPVTAADDVAAVTTEPQGEAATPDTRAEAAVADTQVEAAVPETPAEAAATDTLVEAVLPDTPAAVAVVEQKIEAPVAAAPDNESTADEVPAVAMPAETIPPIPDLGEPDGAIEAIAVEQSAEAEVPQAAVAQEDAPSPETEPSVAPTLASSGAETIPVPQQEVAEPEPPVSEATPETPPETPTALSAEPEPAVCARVGPFEPAAADELLQKLPSNFELLSDSSEEQTVNDGYYVLIPALPDRATGLSRLQELKEAGFEDTWLFRRGAYRNAISLGLFRREGSAKRHAAKVAAKGFDVEVRARTKTAERRWLHLKHAGEGDMQDALPLPDGVSLAAQECP